MGSSDVAGNAITAAKIKDGEVKAAEIATDAVGAAGLQGVTKLLYSKCAQTSDESALSIAPSNVLAVQCSISGVDISDAPVTTLGTANPCFDASQAFATSGTVTVYTSETIAVLRRQQEQQPRLA